MTPIKLTSMTGETLYVNIGAIAWIMRHDASATSIGFDAGFSNLVCEQADDILEMIEAVKQREIDKMAQDAGSV